MKNSDTDSTGVVIVDHGSKRAQSNDMLLEVVALFREHSRYRIVEPAQRAGERSRSHHPMSSC